VDKQPEPREEKPREVQTNNAPIPIVQVRGEGYVTRKDGTVVPFTLKGEG
jgi:hypothetical protein